MKNISIWSDIDRKDRCPKLDKDIDVDVLIIGGGITGMSTLYHLSKSNMKVCLVEKNMIGSGVTSRTTGKLTYLQEDIFSKLIKYQSIEKSKLYLESQKDAIEIATDIIKENNIDCNLERVDSYIFSYNKNNKLNEEIKVLKNFGVDIKETNILPNNEKVNKACYVNDTYVFHPIKYLYSLKNICLNKNVSIYEDTKVKSINRDKNLFICECNNNIISAKYVVLALHYPYFLLPFLLPFKSYIEKSYIEAYKVNKDYKFSSISISKPTVSSRYHKDNNNIYELYLTSTHNTCIKSNDRENFDKLLNLKCNKPDYLWSNKDIITNDSLPFIGSINDDNTLLIGTGYNTWGMSNGTLAGKILSDIIIKNKNKYIDLFDPLRKINTGKIIKFPLIIGCNALSFIKTKVNKQKEWYSSSVKFEKRNGKNIAIYTDENNIEHIVYNLCPHMKCSLIFNEIEKTWDCPCHGSRFDIDGKVIEGPSNYNITYKE